MAYSYADTPGDGVNAEFNITFGYLLRDHIFVDVDGVPVTFTFLDDFRVLCDAVPAAATTVRVKRVTPLGTRYVDFKNGSTLIEGDLDGSADHALFIVQEAFDAVDSKMDIDPATLDWDALSKKITNLADPVAAQDAVTKTWAETAMSSSLAAALVAETNAAASAVSAASSASTANTHKVAAAASEAAASTSETNAAASAAAALVSETNAGASAVAASSSEVNAATHATNASNSEVNAATHATNANNSAIAAAASESNASTSESNAAASAALAAATVDAPTTTGTAAAFNAANGETAYTSGRTYLVDFDQACAKDATLQFEALPVKDMYLQAGHKVIAGSVSGVHSVYYDGTKFIVTDPHNVTVTATINEQAGTQVIPQTVYTKVTFDTSVDDPHGMVDLVNNRITPNVPGRYAVTMHLQYNANTQSHLLNIFKNGSLYKESSRVTALSQMITGEVECNGTTDYIEMFAYHSMATAVVSTLTGAYRNYFTMTKIGEL